jgi:hypothetical protein
MKGLFRAAAKAVTRRDPDAPKPEARKRRGGGTDSRVLFLRRRPHHVTEPAARGCYARLAVPTAEPANEFVRAANILCSIAQDIADMFTDLNERLAEVFHGKGLYLSDNTLDWLNLWQDNANNEQWQNEDFGAKQDNYFPQP